MQKFNYPSFKQITSTKSCIRNHLNISSKYHCLHHDVSLRKQKQLRPGRVPFLLKTPIQETIPYSQGLHHFISSTMKFLSWPGFLNLLHLIEPDPIFPNQSQNPQQDASIHLRLSWLYSFYGNHYFDQEEVRYSISHNRVCDVNKKFMPYLAVYPGSFNDNYVFSNMHIAQQPEKFFDQNQFLL
ncbi:hypothetical protein VP01_4953g1, partial [Puccinia sorghi]